MSFFATLEADVQLGITNLETFWGADVWPYVKEFISLMATQAGKAMLAGAVESIPAVVTGNETVAAATVAAAITSSLANNARADLTTVLNQASADAAAAEAATAEVEAPAAVEPAPAAPVETSVDTAPVSGLATDPAA